MSVIGGSGYPGRSQSYSKEDSYLRKFGIKRFIKADSNESV
jgi:hypothetical protein